MLRNLQTFTLSRGHHPQQWVTVVRVPRPPPKPEPEAPAPAEEKPEAPKAPEAPEHPTSADERAYAILLTEARALAVRFRGDLAAYERATEGVGDVRYARAEPSLQPPAILSRVRAAVAAAHQELAAIESELLAATRAASVDGAATFTVYLDAELAGPSVYAETEEGLARAAALDKRKALAAVTKLGLPPSAADALLVARVFSPTPKEYVAAVAALRGRPDEAQDELSRTLRTDPALLWDMGPVRHLAAATVRTAARSVGGAWFVAAYVATSRGQGPDPACVVATSQRVWKQLQDVADDLVPRAMQKHLAARVLGASTAPPWNEVDANALLGNAGDDTVVTRLAYVLVELAAMATLPADHSPAPRGDLSTWANSEEGRDKAFGLFAALQGVVPPSQLDRMTGRRGGATGTRQFWRKFLWEAAAQRVPGAK